MSRTSILAQLAREVRGDTLRFLQAARPEELTWAPARTSNHLLWHAGHALWLQDVLCVKLLVGESELPFGWEALFGMDSRPAKQRKPWPDKPELLDRLQAQLSRIEELLPTVADAALDRPPHSHPGDDRTLGYCILHGLHDEAKHQG